MKTFLKYHVIYSLIIVSLISYIIFVSRRTCEMMETFKDITWCQEHSADSLRHSVELLKENTDFNSNHPDRSEATFRRVIQLDLPQKASVQCIFFGNFCNTVEDIIRGKSKHCFRPFLLNAGICDFFDEKDMEKKLRQTEHLHQGFVLCFTVMMPRNSDISSDCLFLEINGQKPVSIPSSKWTYRLDISSYHPDYKICTFMIPFQFENTEMRAEYSQYLQRLGRISPVLLPQSLLQSTDWINTMQLQLNQEETLEVQIFDFPLICFS